MPYLSDPIVWSTGREDTKVLGYTLGCLDDADLLAQCKLACEATPSCKSIELKLTSMECCLNTITYSEAVDAGVDTDFTGFIYYDYDTGE